ncbi:hypothetical protein BASA60_010009 [Batrachochytrium salamandrivorans]|nr:hypothetical protein BASA60_010009 [Batrachochytrium salamandrivorans]
MAWALGMVAGVKPTIHRLSTIRWLVMLLLFTLCAQAQVHLKVQPHGQDQAQAPVNDEPNTPAQAQAQMVDTSFQKKEQPLEQPLKQPLKPIDAILGTNVAHTPSSSDASAEATKIYNAAIELLRSLAPNPDPKTRRPSPMRDANDIYTTDPIQSQLESMEDLLSDLVHMFKRILYSKVSWMYDLLSFMHFTTPSHAHNTDPLVEFELEEQFLLDKDNNIPPIHESDSAIIQRAKAVKWLNVAAYQFGSLDALRTLGELYLFRAYGHRRNATMAFQHYMALATKGDSHAQFLVGSMYATGVGIQRNYPKALVYMSFASMGNHIQAHQTLGYWHTAGIGMPKNCEAAGYHYSIVAASAIKDYREGPLGGRSLPEPPTRLPDLEGGIYGNGASGSGNPAKHRAASTVLSNEDILTFYRLQAETGDAYAQLITGQLYYQGTDTTEKDLFKALKFFERAADQHPGIISGSVADVPQAQLQAARSAAKAAGYLGLMHSRGEGVELDMVKARKWYERGVAQDNGASFYGLGIMYMNGLGDLPKDEIRGVKLLNQAINHDNTDAMVHLAEHLMKAPKVDLARITLLLNKAAQNSHLLAFYHMGRMLLKGKGVVPNCKSAVTYLKAVSERAIWKDDVFVDAQAAIARDDQESAFVHYLFAAERGFEVSQTNAAWMLDRQLYKPSDSSLLKRSIYSADPYASAMYLWNRAANQGNEDARVKMGDYYYYGLGFEGAAEDVRGAVSDENAAKSSESPRNSTWVERLLGVSFISHGAIISKPNYERAATYYLTAAETDHSSIAMFNLAYMYEYGLGMTKDLHLAKRWYDMALSTNPATFIAVNLALSNLMIKWGVSYALSCVGLESLGFSTDLPIAVTPPITDEAPPAPPPSSNMHDDDQEYSEDLVQGNFFAILLFVVAAGLMFWRNRLEHQHRAQEVAIAAHQRQVDAQRRAQPPPPTALPVDATVVEPQTPATLTPTAIPPQIPAVALHTPSDDVVDAADLSTNIVADTPVDTPVDTLVDTLVDTTEGSSSTHRSMFLQAAEMRLRRQTAENKARSHQRDMQGNESDNAGDL